MIDIHLDADGQGQITLPTGARTIAASSLSAARSEVIVILTNHAQTSGRILNATVTAPNEGTTALEVHPNGTINELDQPVQQEAPMTTTESQEHSPTPEPVATPAPVPPRPATPPQGDTSPPPAPRIPVPQPSHRAIRFLRHRACQMGTLSQLTRPLPAASSSRLKKHQQQVCAE